MTKEKILKEFDKITLTLELSTSESWQDYVLRYNKKLKDLFIQSLTQIRQETLEEVLKMLPEELKILKKHKGKSFCPQCEDSGFNSCLEEIKENLLKLKGDEK